MPRNNSEEERLTEDEIARRKLGPRGVPGGEDSGNDATAGKEHSEGRGIRRPRRVVLGAMKPSGPSLARDFDVGSRRLFDPQCSANT